MTDRKVEKEMTFYDSRDMGLSIPHSLATHWSTLRPCWSALLVSPSVQVGEVATLAYF